MQNIIFNFYVWFFLICLYFCAGVTKTIAADEQDVLRCLEGQVREGDVDAIKKSLQQLESIAEMKSDSRNFYVQFLSAAMTLLLKLPENDKYSLDIDSYEKKIIEKKPDSVIAKGEQIQVLWRLLSNLDSRLHGADDFATMRRTLTFRLIEIWSEIELLKDDNWDADSDKCKPAPAEGSIKFIISGLDPSMLTDPFERQKYEEYIERVEKYWKKDSEQKSCRSLLDKMRIGTINCIQAAYILPPYKTEELQKAFLDYKTDALFIDEAMIPLKEHITKIQLGFRAWKSTDDLFKVEAKFISFDEKNKNVTLEKADGKRTTIELSALRQLDQDYVKTQQSQQTSNETNTSTP
ncbi:MAG: SHD1 domain-containing protein [Thermoguttaceae bacterium]